VFGVQQALRLLVPPIWAIGARRLRKKKGTASAMPFPCYCETA
jgi:hypothetical protein